jgi:hypothetical protein
VFFSPSAVCLSDDDCDLCLLHVANFARRAILFKGGLNILIPLPVDAVSAS